jgi:hypothetical protein
MMSHAVNKKAFSNGSKSVEDENFFFLNHFNLSKKTLVFDVWINDKFLDKDQSFQDTLCHKHYNIFSHSEKNFLIV